MEQFTFYANRPSENYNKIDMWLMASVLLLWGFGIFTLFVCTQNYGLRQFNDSLYFVKRQLISSLIGFILFFGFIFTDIRIIRKMIAVIVIVSIILCLMTFISPLAITRNGARRWLKMPGGFTFQPSELIKFSLILFLANYFDKQEKIENPENKTVFQSVLGLCICVCVVFAQKDFSTGVFVTLIGILMFFVTGQKLLWILPFGIIALPAISLMVVLESFRIQRVRGWIKPDDFASGINYQAIAAKRAISAGGLWGSGIGVGLSRINSIPEVQADYIFAGWSEAMGFAGVIAYFAMLSFFAWRGYKTALRCPERFSAYSAFGCVSIIVLQSLVNTMVVGGLLPATGINLPFFSLGGSSIIVTLAMCGFILNTSRCEKISEKNTGRDEIYIDSLTYL